MTRFRILIILFITALMINLSGPLHVSAAAPHAAAALDINNPQEISRFFDTLLTLQLRQKNIPGATLSLVKNGQILYLKGYGLADTASQRPVDPSRSLFHIGSITKTFTWTAVMQLVEQGKLDLHTDVNQYLKKFQIPAAYPQPITLAHLLTHTPGFDDQLSTLFRFAPNEQLPLEDYLIKHLPARVYPPGKLVAYSNYGAALAGYIVQEVSGEAYPDYIQQHILKPLGMQHTSAAELPPAALQPDLAAGYGPSLSGQLIPVQEYLPGPAGGMSATAEDMAYYMIAHLHNGEYQGARILNPESAQAMHTPQYAIDPRLNGMTYGMMQGQRNGQPYIWHSGGTAVFFSMMLLFPNQDLGLFVSYNGPQGSQARIELRDTFLDAFFPLQIQAPQPRFSDPAAQRQSLQTYAGNYRNARFGYNTFDKLIFSMSWVDQARLTSQNTLSFRDKEWVEVEPDVLRGVDGRGMLLFLRDGQGHIQYAAQDTDPHEVQIRMAWFEDPFLILGLGGLALIVLWLAALLSLRWRKKGLPTPLALGYRLNRWAGLVYLIFGLWCGTAAGLVVIRSPLELMGSFDKIMTYPLVLPILAFLLGLAQLVCTLWAWKTPGRLGHKITLSLLTLTALSLTAWFNYWNLLGWKF